jgi:hypothetical protein
MTWQEILRWVIVVFWSNAKYLTPPIELGLWGSETMS